MGSIRKRVWLGVGVLALCGAGAVALTTPRDSTHFVSVRRPAAPGAKAVKASVPGSRREPAVTSRTGVPGASLAPGLGDTPPADPPPPAAAPRPSERLGAAATSRNLFRPLVAKQSALAAGLAPAMVGLDGLPVLTDPRSPGGKRRADWGYTGTVQLEGTTYALLEERKSKAGLYLKAGDTFHGGRVDLVRPEYVAISVAGRRYALPKSTGMAEVPADAAAAAATATPAQSGAPGTAAAPAGGQQPGGAPAPGSDASRAATSVPGSPPTNDPAALDQQRGVGQQDTGGQDSGRFRYGGRRRRWQQ